jgi:uncharacterized protein YebE (UPF0316 family)
MSEYRLDVEGELELSDYSSIHDYIGVIEGEDKLTIVVDKKGAADRTILCSMLINECFIISSEKKECDGKYHICAYKKR